MYRRTDAQRFELIIRQLAAGRDNSAIAEGGRWLLTRWHAARARG
jgi:hypothetical protein